MEDQDDSIQISAKERIMKQTLNMLMTFVGQRANDWREIALAPSEDEMKAAIKKAGGLEDEAIMDFIGDLASEGVPLFPMQIGNVVVPNFRDYIANSLNISADNATEVSQEPPSTWVKRTKNDNSNREIG